MRRLRLALVVAVLAALAPPLAGARIGAAPDATPLGRVTGRAGRLLVAHPNMAGNFFAGTVIVLLRDGEGGAFGLVVNRPLGREAAEALFRQLDPELGERARQAGLALYLGGPVDTALLFLLHATESGFAAGDPRKLLPLPGSDRRAMLVLGYAGWSAGQLDSEIARGDWLVVDADADLVFGGDDDGKWERAVSRTAPSPLPEAPLPE